MYTPIKRIIDIVLSGVGIIVLSPLLLVLCIAIKLDSPGPILFKQKRVGIHKKHFMIYKFRTMRTDTPKDMPTHMLSNPEQYITRTGKFLRKTSLDELPQIFNIFKGDMSIVGPRPLLVQYLPLYNERQRHRHDVRPGLTGWAQVHGRNSISWEEKFDYDIYYVANIAITLDISILFKTFKTVIKRDGINSESDATMEDFKGTMK